MESNRGFVRGALKIFLFLSVIAIALGFAAFNFFEKMSLAASTTGDPVPFVVAKGATGRSVASELEERGLIVDKRVFRLLLRYYAKKDGASLKAGHFMVDPKQDVKGVLNSLLAGAPITRKATIPEGLTKTEIAESLGHQGVVDAKDFLAALAKVDLGWKFPDDLEGYLFPSTYEFPLECTGEQAVSQMASQFRGIVEPMMEAYSETAPLSLGETIVLASLVEREAQVASERSLIAGVYVNRIKKGMKLQCDATVQFALGEQKAVLLYRDLEIDSPYNTYRYEGLPPGPICSPGAASLEAAFNPESSDYLFYVRNDVKNDGSHVFGRDFAEHEANIGRFQR